MNISMTGEELKGFGAESRQFGPFLAKDSDFFDTISGF
jgi:hypothetical protein